MISGIPCRKKDNEITCLQNLVKELQEKLETVYLKPNISTRKGPHPVEADIITKIAEEKAAVKNPEARSTNKKALPIGKQRPFEYQFKLLPSEDTVSLCSHRDTVKVKYVPEFPYTCELCDKGFTHRGNLNKHMNDHKGLSNEVMTPQDYDEIRDKLMSNNAPKNKPQKFPEVHSCEKCDNIFTNKPALQEHNNIYHKEISQTKSKVQSCSHCEEGFNTTLLLGDHIDMVHMDTFGMNNVVCSCVYPCTPIEPLGKVSMEAPNFRPVDRDDTGGRQGWKDREEEQEQQETRQGPLGQEETIEGQQVARGQEEARQEAGEQEETGEGVVGQQETQLATGGQKETWQVAGGSGRFTCDICGKTRNTRSKMEKHMSDHEEDLEDGSHTCNKCSYQTRNRDELVKHIYRAHGIQVQEKCTQ